METDDLAFLQTDDFTLADSVAMAIEAHYGYDRLMSWESDIPIECRVVHFTWTATGHAECEGYVAFMMMECHHSALALCFNELGLTDLASIIGQMLVPIPEHGVLGNMETLEQHFGGWENFAAWAAKFETELFAASKRIQHAVAGYCRAHAASFKHLGK